MSLKTPDEKLIKIRELRTKGYSLSFICNAVQVSITVVQQACKGINIDLRYKKPEIPQQNSLHPCYSKNISDLPDDLQKYYLSLKPPNQHVDKKTYITASKGDYGKESSCI